MRLRRVLTVGIATTVTATGFAVFGSAGPASAAIHAGSTCPSGYVCIYDSPNATGTGWALLAPSADSNLGLSPEITSFNDRMESWKNNSGRTYCWYVNDRYRDSNPKPMPSYGNGRVVNLTSGERNTASSLAPC